MGQISMETLRVANQLFFLMDKTSWQNMVFRLNLCGKK
jgi:hypothetical protein